jgi:hypothetical protein
VKQLKVQKSEKRGDLQEEQRLGNCEESRALAMSIHDTHAVLAVGSYTLSKDSSLTRRRLTGVYYEALAICRPLLLNKPALSPKPKSIMRCKASYCVGHQDSEIGLIR